MPTDIEWVQNPDGTKGESWNPITGCSHAGTPGCDNCYARRLAQRLRGRFGYPKDDPFRVTYHPDRLERPLGWQKPRRVFVCSMSDLFHENVAPGTIAEIVRMMSCCHRHKFLVLTKRPERMKSTLPSWPLPNIWLGASVENHNAAIERIPHLLEMRSRVLFVSCEPLLGPIDLTRIVVFKEQPGICIPVIELLDWVIVGCESGPRARPTELNWVRGIKNQCNEFHVPLFIKQLRIDGRLSRDLGEWPEDLRLREYPLGVG